MVQTVNDRVNNSTFVGIDPLVEKKAVLALGGAIKLPEGFELPFRVSRSTAGPGAGFYSMAIGFGGLRVKKSVSYETGEFQLVVDGERLSLLHNGKPFLDEIEIQPVVRHCPGQAFFNLDPRCDNRCAFCSSPLLDKNDVKDMSPERILEMLEESMSMYRVDALSLTSGVVGGTQSTIDRFISVIELIHSKYPDLRIGVEPYVDSREQIQSLKDAGADEIKLNLQCATPEIFSKICPDLDRDRILEMLRISVEIFGKGNVISNVIYGFGETDEDLRRTMVELSEMGVIPGMRALRINSYNRESLTAAIGHLEITRPERTITVAEMQKEVMTEYGLDSRSSRTMCLECGCCDIVPFRDI